MPVNGELETPREDPTEAEEALSEGVGPGERVLGRGLADISHLFLSPSGESVVACEPAPAAAVEPAPTPPAVTPAPAPPAEFNAPLLLEPYREFTRDQLSAFVIGHAKELEEGMQVIDANAPCGDCGAIDVLGVDRRRRPTIIDFDTEQYDGLLLRAIGHLDWLVRHATIAQHMYHGHDIDFSARPRIILLARDFSPLLRCAARQIACARIDWLTYHAVQVPGGVGLLLERL